MRMIISYRIHDVIIFNVYLQYHAVTDKYSLTYSLILTTMPTGPYQYTVVSQNELSVDKN